MGGDVVRDSQDLLFSNDGPTIEIVEPKGKGQQAWKILVVDDEESIHQVTRMVLSDFKFQGRPLEIIQGYSGADACRLVKEHPDAAVLLLDVVMESDSAGLDAVQYIRHELNNSKLRIILRTGQPGRAPERDVITQYDINDYKEKTDLTAQRLFTSVTAALRAYSDIKKIEQLATSNESLEQKVTERTKEIMLINQRLQGEVVAKAKAYEKLKESQRRLNEAQLIAHIGNWEYLMGNNQFSCSEQVLDILGISDRSLLQHYSSLLNFIPDEDRSKVEATFKQAIHDRRDFDLEHKLIRMDGALIHVHQQAQIEVGESGKVVRVVGTLQDVTSRRVTEEQMRKLSGVVDQIADSVMITDHNGVIEYVNPSFETMTGYSKSEVLGKTPRVLKSGKQNESFYEELWRTIKGGEIFCDVIINKNKQGDIYYEEKTITPQKDQHGNVIHYISTGKDVTERIKAQERLYHLAHHDSLTGLPNRILLQDRLSQAISRATWHNRYVAVMFMDVDRFKVINDTLGHDVGDELLVHMSQRLSACVREGDTVARLGGDEFAIILNDIACEEDVTPIADKILQSLSEPVEIKGSELYITSSIGICLYPRDGKDGVELLKKADVAMYRAKSLGKDNYQIYSSDDENHIKHRLSVESCLRRALERDEFELNYQPQVRISDNTIMGYEALLRWYNDELKSVSPVQFIPILEETGMINEVGEWVLMQACSQEKLWQQQGMPPRRVAVNISIKQLKHRGFVKAVERVLTQTGLDPQYLELEITESLLIDSIEETSIILHQLHELGVSLSIDDFGTGYSSMSYLKKLPFDALKIDRAFIRDITFNDDDAAITNAMISLAHSLNMEVIAEGVESTSQLQYLNGKECDLVQGFLYSPPLTADAFAIFVNENVPQLFDFGLNKGPGDEPSYL